MSIQVNDFQWEPGKNDAEYIKLLESSRDEWQKIAQKAIAKLKALSKAQEPVVPVARVMTLEELIGIYNLRENHSWVYNTPPYFYMDYGKDTGHWISWSNIVSCLERCYPKYIPEDYGKTWRCWTSRPDEERRAETPWN